MSFSEFDFLDFLSCRSRLFISFFNYLVSHLHGLPLTFFCIVGSCLSKILDTFVLKYLNALLTSDASSIGFQLMFFISLHRSLWLFAVKTFDCSWIVFAGVDFLHTTNHIMITEGQRER